MIPRVFRLALRHRALVTCAMIGVLLINLLVVARVAPADPTKSDIPVAGRCQGGGPGCDEQPLIPPPAAGLPRFDGPTTPVFGALVAIQVLPVPAIHEAPPSRIDPPPRANAAV